MVNKNITNLKTSTLNTSFLLSPNPPVFPDENDVQDIMDYRVNSDETIGDILPNSFQNHKQYFHQWNITHDFSLLSPLHIHWTPFESSKVSGGHICSKQLGTFIIMLAENLKQSTLYRYILTQETVQVTVGRNRYILYFRLTLNLHYPQADRVKIQIMSLVLTFFSKALPFTILQNYWRIVFSLRYPHEPRPL